MGWGCRFGGGPLTFSRVWVGFSTSRPGFAVIKPGVEAERDIAVPRISTESLVGPSVCLSGSRVGRCPFVLFVLVGGVGTW